MDVLVLLKISVQSSGLMSCQTNGFMKFIWAIFIKTPMHSAISALAGFYFPISLFRCLTEVTFIRICILPMSVLLVMNGNIL